MISLADASRPRNQVSKKQEMFRYMESKDVELVQESGTKVKDQSQLYWTTE